MNSGSPAAAEPRSVLGNLYLLLGGTFLLLLWTASRTTLWNIDEGRIAEVAREMWLTGDWLTPRIGGLPFPCYPPLAYWLMAVSGGLLGFSEIPMRLPSILAALALIAAVASIARRRAGEKAGLLAGLALATQPVFFIQASMCRADVLTCCFAVAAFDRFHAWAEGGGRARDLAGMYVLSALGILAKGPIALAVLGFAGLGWFLSSGKWKLLLKMRFELGIPLMLVIVLPWYVLVNRVNGPEFLQRNLMMENADAFASGYEHSRPFTFYFSRAPLMLLPWCLSLLLLIRVRRVPGVVATAIWLVATFAFLTVSGSKRPSYITYLAAPLALCAGLALDAARREAPRLLHRSLLGVCGVLGLAALVIALLPQRTWTGIRVSHIAPHLPMLAGATILPAVLLLGLTLRKGAAAGLGGLGALLALAFGTYAGFAAPRLDKVGQDGSAFCRRASALIPATETVYILEQNKEPEGSIQFYFRAPLPIRRESLPGLYVLPQAQLEFLRSTGRRVDLLDSFIDERERSVNLARVHP